MKVIGIFNKRAFVVELQKPKGDYKYLWWIIDSKEVKPTYWTHKTAATRGKTIPFKEWKVSKETKEKIKNRFEERIKIQGIDEEIKYDE